LAYYPAFPSSFSRADPFISIRDRDGGRDGGRIRDRSRDRIKKN